ncbi:MAG TPA: hypothetical protein VM049_00290 [Gaiellaceae bacterium]|nr:hypothetical protein [Gaiellaceae bacterium]
MGLVDQWRRLGSELPAGWSEARLALRLPHPEQRERAAFLLSPAGPSWVGDTLHLSVRRGGGGIGPDQCTKLLGKLEDERIVGTLSLLGTAEREVEADVPGAALVHAWTAALAELPEDWSDLYCELEVDSSDYLQRGALLLAPVNPARVPGRSAFRFRVAHSFGYGASPQMTARCLERVDDEGVTGRLTILRVLSDTHNVATQGPVWRVEGKAV